MYASKTMVDNYFLIKQPDFGGCTIVKTRKNRLEPTHPWDLPLAYPTLQQSNLPWKIPLENIMCFMMFSVKWARIIQKMVSLPSSIVNSWAKLKISGYSSELELIFLDSEFELYTLW